MTGTTAAATPITAAVTKMVVSFRQIDRLYDLQWTAWSRQFLAYGDEGPAVVTVWKYSGLFEATDDKGRRVPRNMRLFGAVYRGLECAWAHDVSNRVFLRTFDREASKPIHNKRVYVFRAKDSQRTGLTLLHELHFDNGLYRHCGPDGVPVGAKSDVLALPALTCVGQRCEMHDCYFLMLTPYALPNGMVLALRGERGRREADLAVERIKDRLLPLWDPFYTDNASPKTDKKFVPLDFSAPAGITRFLRVHLVDPVDEAILRAKSFQALFAAWCQETEKIASVDKYRLACQIRAIVQGDRDLEALVNHDRREPLEGLYSYLNKVEAQARRLRAAMENAGTGLMRWLGVSEKPCKLAFCLPALEEARFFEPSWPASDTFILAESTLTEIALAPTGRLRMPPSPPPAGYGNQYAGLIDIFAADKESNSVSEQLELTGVACLTNIGSLPDAAHTLNHILPKLAAQPKRSNAAVLAERIEDLVDGSSTVKRSWDLWLQLSIPALKAVDGEEFKDAVKAMVKYNKVEKSNLTKFRDANLNALAAIGQLIDTIVSIEVFWEASETREGYDAVSNVVKLYYKTTDWVKTYEMPKIEWSRGVFVSAKMLPINLLFGSIDCVLKISDATKRRNHGAALVAGLGAAGAILGIAGTAALASTGVGIAFALAGLGIEALAKLLESRFDDMKVFLRHTVWGTGNDNEKADWSSRLRLSQLRASIPAQEQALHDVIYGTYEVVLELIELNGHRTPTVRIKPPVKYKIIAEAKFGGYFSIQNGFGSSNLKLPPDGGRRLARGETVKLDGSYQIISGAPNYLSASMWMDVYGDGRILVKRNFD